MSGERWVCLVFCDGSPGLRYWPARVEDGGLFYRTPDGRPVCRWALDYVAAGDERWMAFGPFPSRAEALSAAVRVRDMVGDAWLGTRLMLEHCMEPLGYRREYLVYTDG